MIFNKMDISCNDQKIKLKILSMNNNLLDFSMVVSAINRFVFIQFSLQATKRKRKGEHIPYRDSVLTWLLRENLGIVCFLYKISLPNF